MAQKDFINHALALDRNSPYYRECANEKCKKEFTANHMHTMHCCQRCHDQKNNDKKLVPNSSIQIAPKPPEPAQVINEEERIKAKVFRNVQLLSQLAIDEKKGTHFHISYLLQIGFDVFGYDVRLKEPNTDEQFYFLIGHFKITKVSNEIFLITNNLKYINSCTHNRKSTSFLAVLFPGFPSL